MGFFASPSHSSFCLFFLSVTNRGGAFLGWASFDRRRRSSLDEIRQKKVAESGGTTNIVFFGSNKIEVVTRGKARRDERTNKRANGRGSDGGKTALAFCYQCQSSGTRFRPVYITRANGTLKFRAEICKAGGKEPLVKCLNLGVNNIIMSNSLLQRRREVGWC